MSLDEDIAEVRRRTAEHIARFPPHGFDPELPRTQALYDAKLAEMQVAIRDNPDHARACLETLIGWVRDGVP